MEKSGAWRYNNQPRYIVALITPSSQSELAQHHAAMAAEQQAIASKADASIAAAVAANSSKTEDADDDYD